MLIKLNDVSKTYHKKLYASSTIGYIKSLFKPNYEKYQALQDVSLDLREGEALGLLGPNGAGKSTLIKILSGIQNASTGDVEVLGVNPYCHGTDFYRNIGVVFGHKSSLWWDLPLRDSFETVKVIYRIEPECYKKNLNELIQALDLCEVLKSPVRNLSLGERVKGEITMNLLFNPKVLLLDEPTIGLDVTSKAEIRELLRRKRRENGLGVFVTSHDMGDINGHCNQVILLNQGQTRFKGSLSELKSKLATYKNIKIECHQEDRAAIIDSIKSEISSIKTDGDKGSICVSLPRDIAIDFTRNLLNRHSKILNFSIQEPSLEEMLVNEFRFYLQEKAR